MAATDWLDWGVASRPMPGEPEAADQHLVRVEGDRALVAVADGLGHGAEAVAAAKKAIATLATSPLAPAVPLVERAHAALAGTRGAVLSVVCLDRASGSLEWVGVGDVEAALHVPGKRRETLMLRGGVVGDRLPVLRASTVACAPGDTLVLATDGVRRSVLEEPVLVGDPRELAARLLSGHAKTTDDALVLVVRCRGVS